MWSVAQTLDQLTTRLSPSLAADDARARMRAVADRLPARLTNCVYLELWPRASCTAGAARADLIVRVDARGRDCLLDPGLAAFDATMRSSLGWQRIAAFARAWASTDGMFDRAIDGAWIEFDLEPTAPEPWLRPRLFVDLAIGAGAGAPPPREETFAIARQIARKVYRRPLVPALRDSLRNCIAYLPDGATLRYLGFTPDRPEAGLRICVSRLGDAWRTYLAAIGWPGDTPSLEEQIVAPIRAARGGARPAIDVLHLDLVPGVAPRIGLEYAFARARQRGGIVDEVEMLDLLVARGWCDEAMRDALRQWPGRSVELLPHEIWHSRVARRVSHVKLAFASGQPIVMKTYLCAFFELLAGGAMVGNRPWHAEAVRGTGALSNSAPARSDDAADTRVARNLAGLPARTHDGAPGSGFAPRTRE